MYHLQELADMLQMLLIATNINTAAVVMYVSFSLKTATAKQGDLKQWQS